jgi:hypothetical protein
MTNFLLALGIVAGGLGVFLVIFWISSRLGK